VVVAYLPLPEPNWQWGFTIVNANQVKLLDGTERAVNAQSDMAYLDLLFRSQQMFTFTDIDGAVWAVGSTKGCIMYDLSHQTAVPAKPLAEAGLEGDVRVTILEAIETY
jgi:hypothetical protein